MKTKRMNMIRYHRMVVGEGGGLKITYHNDFIGKL